MGNACCVAARDKMVLVVPPNETERRHSPTWSFRWDNHNRGRRVAGEDSSLTWLSDGISRNDGSEIKFGSAFVSSQGSPLDSFRTQPLHKSPASGNSFQLGNLLNCHDEQKKDMAMFYLWDLSVCCLARLCIYLDHNMKSCGRSIFPEKLFHGYSLRAGKACVSSIADFSYIFEIIPLLMHNNNLSLLRRRKMI